MSTQVSLEEQVWSALLSVNDHRLEAHTAASAADLNSTYAAFENLISEARKGKAALDQIMDIKEQERLEELETWRQEHHESECDDRPDAGCDRDHEAEMADSLAETRWEQERDAA